MTTHKEALKLPQHQHFYYSPDDTRSVRKPLPLYTADQMCEYAAAAIKEALKEHAMSEVQRLGQEIEQEPVMILPDGSAFGVMSFPLPDDHWLYAPNEYKDGEYEPIDLPKPILTHELRDAVVAAVRYAVRGATMRGQETDFDPDALVQNAVYALCGPYATPPKPKPEQEPVAWMYVNTDGECEQIEYGEPFDDPSTTPLYTTAPQRTEQNFCSRCGKRTKDLTHIHTCTPPREGT